MNTHDSVTAYFFFDFNDVNKQSAEGLVRSLLFQLIAKLDAIPDELQTLYSKHRRSPSATPLVRFQEWCDILKSCLRRGETRYIFIDALDECGEADSYLLPKTLQSLFEETAPAVKWFVTCRPSQRSVTILRNAGFTHSSMDPDVVDNDIQRYLSTRLEEDPRLASFGPTARKLIVAQVTSKSSGM